MLMVVYKDQYEKREDCCIAIVAVACHLVVTIVKKEVDWLYLVWLWLMSGRSG